MRLPAILLHAAVLAILNLTGAVLGFWLSRYIPGQSQAVLQGFLGLLLTTSGYLFWLSRIGRLPRRLVNPGPLAIRRPRDLLWVWLLAWPCGCLIFYPLHRVTQGYPSSTGNLLALLGYQYGINAVVLLLAPRGCRK
jgi:hypothetical protein